MYVCVCVCVCVCLASNSSVHFECLIFNDYLMIDQCVCVYVCVKLNMAILLIAQ